MDEHDPVDCRDVIRPNLTGALVKLERALRYARNTQPQRTKNAVIHAVGAVEHAIYCVREDSQQ